MSINKLSSKLNQWGIEVRRVEKNKKEQSFPIKVIQDTILITYG